VILYLKKRSSLISDVRKIAEHDDKSDFSPVGRVPADLLPSSDDHYDISVIISKSYSLSYRRKRVYYYLFSDKFLTFFQAKKFFQGCDVQFYKLIMNNIHKCSI
jgi:hypothetical protein